MKKIKLFLLEKRLKKLEKKYYQAFKTKNNEKINQVSSEIVRTLWKKSALLRH